MYSADFSNNKDVTISVPDFESTESKKGIEEIMNFIDGYSHDRKQ